VIFGQSLILKLFRRVEPGLNPDLELGRYLSEKTSFASSPTVAGSIDYQADGAEPATLGIIHEFVPNEGDSWQYTLDALGRFYERVVTERIEPGGGGPPDTSAPLLERAAGPVPEEIDEMVGSYIQSAQPDGAPRRRDAHRLRRGGIDPGLTPGAVHAALPAGVYQSLRKHDRPARCRCCGRPPPISRRARAPTPRGCSRPRAGCSTGSPPSPAARSRSCGSAVTAISTSARSSSPAATS